MIRIGRTLYQADRYTWSLWIGDKFVTSGTGVDGNAFDYSEVRY